VTGFDAVLLRHLLLEKTFMQSILQILAINEREFTYKSGALAGQKGKISEAHCVLLNDDGTAAAVGVLNVPKALQESAKIGTYRAGFALEAPTYGDNQGKIIAALKSLQPVQAKPQAVAGQRAA
jgi:hypothetical protein